MFRYRKMDLFERSQIEYALENFVNRKIEKLNDISLMKIIDDPPLLLLFKKYISRGHTAKTESMILLERFILCEKNLKSTHLIDNSHVIENLLELCTTFHEEERIRRLLHPTIEKINRLYEVEKNKWNTLTLLICHDDYKRFLTSVKKKSNLIKNILIFTYGDDVLLCMYCLHLRVYFHAFNLLQLSNYTL